MFTTVGPYRIEGELARGGAGVVYLARDPDGGEAVVKLLLGGTHAHEKALKRFEREGEVLARLDHPHVVRVLGVGVDHGLPYLAMERIRGESLQARLDAQGPLDPEHARALTLQVAAAVQHAHEAGVLHRDLKPANVLLDEAGRAKLTDFGLVKELNPGDQTKLSLTGQLLGTPGYWPPEQARGDRGATSVRSDVYGLGALLYALLTGRPPFTGESLVDVLGKVGERPAPPSAHRPGLPADVEAICLRCLEPDPARRFPTAADVGAALAAPAAPVPARGSAWLAAGLAGLGAVGALAVVALRSQPASAPASPVASVAEPTPSALDARARRAALVEAQARADRAASLASCLEPLAPLLAADPDDLDAHAVRVRLLTVYRDPEADAALDTFSKRAPLHPQVCLTMAIVASRGDDFQAELAMLAMALDADPDAYFGLCRMSDAQRRAGDQAAALRHADRAISLYPEQPFPWIVRARAHTDPELAASDRARAAAIDPEHPALLRDRLHAHEAAGELDEALVLARELTERFPDRPWGLRAQAQLHLTAGRFDEAAVAWGRVLDQGFPADPRAGYSGRATLLPGLIARDRGQLEEAGRQLLVALSAAQERGDSTAFVHAARCLRAVEDRRWREAQTETRLLLAEAFSQLELGWQAQALPLFERAVELDPDDPVAVAGRAGCRRLMSLAQAPDAAPPPRNDAERARVEVLAALFADMPPAARLAQAEDLLERYPEQPVAYWYRIVAGRLARVGVPAEVVTRGVRLRDHDDPTLALIHYRYGQALLETQPALAHESLLRALALNPHQMLAHSAILLSTADPAEADRAAARLMRIAPDRAELYERLTQLALRRDELDTALRHARAATWLDPRDPVGWRYLAQVQDRLGNAAAARRSRQRSEQLERTGASLASLQAERDRAFERTDAPRAYARAATRLSDAVARDWCQQQTDASPLRVQGIGYLEQGRIERALLCFRRGLQLDPDAPIFLAGSGYCRRQLGEDQPPELERVDSTSPWTYLILSLASGTQLDVTPQQWLQQASFALGIHPGFGPLLRLRALARIRLGQSAAAAGDLDAAVADADDPTRALSYLMRGMLTGRGGESVAADLAAAIELCPDLVRARIGAGRVALEAGDLALARRHLERAHALEPAADIIHCRLAQLYARDERPVYARRLATLAAHAFDSPRPVVWRVLAQLEDDPERAAAAAAHAEQLAGDE